MQYNTEAPVSDLPSAQWHLYPAHGLESKRGASVFEHPGRFMSVSYQSWCQSAMLNSSPLEYVIMYYWECDYTYPAEIIPHLRRGLREDRMPSRVLAGCTC